MEKYVNEKGHFLMSLKDAQDLFSKIGELSIANSMIPALRFQNDNEVWAEYFFEDIPSVRKQSFLDLKSGHYIAKELGFKPTRTTEVSILLVGKSVKVKIFDTNTRPMFTEVGLVEDALDLGFELGKSKNKFYLKKDGEIFKKGKVINDDYRYNILADHNPDPPYLRRWEVRIKKIVLDKIVCRCTYMADYSFYPDNDQSV